MKVKSQPADSVRGDSGTFVDFARRLMQVPHSEIKAELEEERAMRERKTPVKRLSSRVPASSKKR